MDATSTSGVDTNFAQRKYQASESNLPQQSLTKTTENTYRANQNSSGMATLGTFDAFVDGLSHYYMNPELSDVTLHVGDMSFYAHKFFLAASSDVFRTMLTAKKWKDSLTSDIHLEEQENCTPYFKEFLSYFYCGQVTVTVDSIMPIFTLADKYNVSKLRKLCEEYMTKQIGQRNVKGALDWLTFAEMYDLASLVNRCYAVIRSNLPLVIHTEGWFSLTIDQICQIATSSEVIIRDEHSFFKALENWLKAQNDSNIGDMLRRLLKYFRFTQMASEQILQIENSAFGIEYQELLKDYILEGYKFHALSTMSNLFHHDKFLPRLFLSGPHCHVVNANVLSQQYFTVNAMQHGQKPRCATPWYMVANLVKAKPKEGVSYVEDCLITYKLQAPNSEIGKSYRLAIVVYNKEDKFVGGITDSGIICNPDGPSASIHWNLQTNIINIQMPVPLERSKDNKVKHGVVIQVYCN
ncbi:BTB/POZ domain-containing protein 17-like [Anneissia japonica]|uniref:BTB/POZ domain-containing protein 17-like n=1 Tax=Anneissia japonica TaxID=1529436 RepID=UPI0014256F48|nr:BTB/POZ domain-containing protein 17-like [Anneissia japonica]XP_033119534.1 BTB/POZ domain-containing protein 17-like [Anneissia japonica]XP_033119535.1 BTB/POZ domain-containing protein 17-like [Anneissia japonica]